MVVAIVGDALQVDVGHLRDPLRQRAPDRSHRREVPAGLVHVAHPDEAERRHGSAARSSAAGPTRRTPSPRRPSGSPLAVPPPAGRAIAASARRASAASKSSSTTRARPVVGCRRNSNSVTTPKFPPPPRRPQNRSAFSVESRGPLAIRRHDGVALDVVAREPELAREPAHAAAEGQSADARVRDVARGRRQPVWRGRPVESPQEGAAPTAARRRAGSTRTAPSA